VEQNARDSELRGQALFNLGMIYHFGYKDTVEATQRSAPEASPTSPDSDVQPDDLSLEGDAGRYNSEKESSFYANSRSGRQQAIEGEGETVIKIDLQQAQKFYQKALRE